MFINNRDKEYLNKKFNLKVTGEEQDWEIELADKNRVQEFINFIRDNQTLSPSIRHALMSLIFASFDDLLNFESKDNYPHYWNQLTSILESDMEMYSDLILYWSALDKTSEDNQFNITPLVRQYVKDLA